MITINSLSGGITNQPTMSDFNLTEMKATAEELKYHKLGMRLVGLQAPDWMVARLVAMMKQIEKSEPGSVTIMDAAVIETLYPEDYRIEADTKQMQ